MKSKYQNLIVITLIFLFLLSVIPAVLGKERKSYLISFIYSTEIDGKGFSNSKNGEYNVSFEATAYALQILDYYGRNPHDKSLLTDNLKENITEMFDENNVNIFNLYFLLKSIDILDSIEDSIDTTLKDRISGYLNQTEQDGGFSISNASSSVSLSSTYFVIQIFSLINESVTIHKDINKHKSWILSCGNIDGGYGGNSSISSNILNTYYAVFLINMLGTLDELVDKNQTLAYLKSFYISDSGDLTNYGGYLPVYLAKYAMLYSTFYCVNAIKLIDDEELNKSPTVNWVIDHQNFIDGGFVDSTDGTEQKLSSVFNSFFAFETLKAFNSLSKLKEEVWMIEFNYWILIGLLGGIGLTILLIYFVWRKRRV